VVAQIFVSAAGIATMTLLAYYLSSSKQQDVSSEIRHRMESIDARS
jgi:hypothetical protein